MATSQSKFGRRLDEESKREVAALASRPGAKQEQVARESGAGRGLRARQKRCLRPRTTDRRHLCPVAHNLLADRAKPPARPGGVWQADITDVTTKEGWLYVAGVLDACSRRIVGVGGR